MGSKDITILSLREIATHSPVSLYTLVPLGACYLGAALEQKGHVVEIVDEYISNIDLESIESDTVLISALTNSAPKAYEYAARLKKMGKRVIMGGMHASMIPEEAARYVDQVIVGEGENVINDIVEGRIKDKIVRSRIIEDLDSLPTPDISLVKGLEKKRHMYSIDTSRGCPFDCSFCSAVKLFGTKYRFRSPENLLEEMRNYDMRKPLTFVDDNFAANPKRTTELCRGMVKEGLVPKWYTAQVRVDVARDSRLLNAISDSGCDLLFIGMESINPQTLKAYNKQQTVDDIKRCVKVLHDHGISIYGFFVVGSDHDTKKTAKTTVDFWHDADIDYPQMTAATPFPGTRMYQDLKQQGRIFTEDWSYYDMEHVVFWPKMMSPYELQRSVLDAFRSFYRYGRTARLLMSGRFQTSLANIYHTIRTRGMEQQFEEYLDFLERKSRKGNKNIRCSV